jgi:hypothetical protein
MTASELLDDGEGGAVAPAEDLLRKLVHGEPGEPPASVPSP